MKRLFFYLALLLFTSHSACSQGREKTLYAFQADLSPYIFSGFSAKTVLFPAKTQRMAIGLEVFKMNYPSFYFQGNNRDWRGAVNFGTDLSIEFSFSDDATQGWSAGPVLVYLDNTMVNRTEVSYQSLQLGVKIDYRWFPFKGKNFFVNPYFIIAHDREVGGDSSTFSPPALSILSSVFLGIAL